MDIRGLFLKPIFAIALLTLASESAIASMNHNFAKQTGQGTAADLTKLPTCYEEDMAETYINQITGQQVSAQTYTSHSHQFQNYRKMYCCQQAVTETDYKVIHQADNGQIYLNLTDIADPQLTTSLNADKLIAQGTILERSGNSSSFTVVSGDHPQHDFNALLAAAVDSQQLNDVAMNNRNSIAQRMSTWFLQTEWPHIAANEYDEGVNRRRKSHEGSLFTKTQNRKDYFKIGDRFSVSHKTDMVDPQEYSACGGASGRNCEHGQIYTNPSSGLEYKAYTDPIPANDTIRASRFNAFQDLADYDIAFTRSGAEHSTLLKQAFHVPTRLYFDWIDFVFNSSDRHLFESDEHDINEYQPAAEDEAHRATLRDVVNTFLSDDGILSTADSLLAPYAPRLLALYRMISWVTPIYHTYKDVDREKLRGLFGSIDYIQTLSLNDLYILISELEKEKQLLDSQNCSALKDKAGCRNFMIGGTFSSRKGVLSFGAATYTPNEIRNLLASNEINADGLSQPRNYFASNTSLSNEQQERYTEIFIDLIARYAGAHLEHKPNLHKDGDHYNTDYRYVIYGLSKVLKFDYHLRGFLHTARKEFVKTNIFRALRDSQNRIVKRVCKIADKRSNMPIPYMRTSDMNREDIALLPAFGNEPIAENRTDSITTVGIHGEENAVAETIENGHNKKLVARAKVNAMLGFNKAPFAIYVPIKNRVRRQSFEYVTEIQDLSQLSDDVNYISFNWANVMALPKQSIYLRNVLKSLNTPKYWKLKHDGHEDTLQQTYARKTQVVGGHVETDEINTGSTGDNPADDIYFSDLNIWFGPGMLYLDTPTLGAMPDNKVTEAFGQGPYNSYKYVSANHYIGASDVQQANAVMLADDVEMVQASLTADDLIGALNFTIHGTTDRSYETASRVRAVEKVAKLAKEYKSESFLKPKAMCSHLRAAEVFNEKVHNGYLAATIDRHDHPKMQFGDFYWKGTGNHKTSHQDDTDHKSHLSGICADYRYGRKNDEIRNVPIFWQRRSGGKVVSHPRNGMYDRELSTEFIKIFKDLGASVIITADTHHRDNEGVYFERGGYKSTKVHNTHIHVCYSSYLPMTPRGGSQGFVNLTTSRAFTDPDSPNGTKEKRSELIDKACADLGTGI